MGSKTRVGLVLWTAIGCAGALLVPATARAQASISGLVQDTTGAVLPGVTVEASSPAIIEGTLSGVTDGQGRYTIENLRPGTYKVTFSLTGFGKVVREGIVLVGDAAVQVNSELKVGSLEESVTVTGQSPIVDVQQTRRQAVVTQEMVDALPGARTIEAQALLVPGMRNTGIEQGVYWPTVHGSTAGDALSYNDGMRATSVIDAGNYKIGWQLDLGATAEMTFETGGAPAEQQVGGMVMNAIPKEGGNRFSGTYFTYYGNGSLQGNNLTPALTKLLGVGNRLGHSIDENPSFGGPIMKNKLWFFSSFHYTNEKDYVADQYFKSGPLGMGEVGQAYNYNYSYSGVLRLTNQLNSKNKWHIGFERLNTQCPFCDVSPLTPPETGDNIPQPVGYHAQLRWNSTVTNRLLIEAGVATQYNKWRREAHPVVADDPYYYELTTGETSGSWYVRGSQPEQRHDVKGSATYVTGSHSLKAGVEATGGYIGLNADVYNGDVRSVYTYNGTPVAFEALSLPLGNFREEINADVGSYVQDKWTIHRLTLNLGARYDHFHASIPAQSAPAGIWVPARSFPEFPGPTWNNVVGRFGVAYDLSGDGKTAIKANLSQFVAGEGTTLTSLRNPLAGQTWAPNAEVRSWTNLDGKGFNVANLTAADVGPSPDQNFGLIADATTLDPNLKRTGHWEYSASLQHELLTGLSITGGFYRRNYYDLHRSVNLAQTPSDYAPFNIAAPLDPNLPGGGGQVITRYNLFPSVFGQSAKYVGNSNIDSMIYTGFELVVNGRLKGAFFNASMTTERTKTNNCDVNDPNLLQYCYIVRPFQTMFKATGAYPLPFGFMVSAFLQAYPGPSVIANYTVTSGIAGLPLTETTIATQLVAPYTMFLPYEANLDLRLMRRFKGRGRLRLSPSIDLFNVLNAHTTIAADQTYGPQWNQPTAIVEPRRLRLGLALDF